MMELGQSYFIGKDAVKERKKLEIELARSIHHDQWQEAMIKLNIKTTRSLIDKRSYIMVCLM